MGEGKSAGLEFKGCLGGEFLLEEVGSYPIFTPEDFSEEQKMYFDTADDFSRNEVVPRVKEIEEKKPGLMVDLLRKAGRIGLLSVDIPEEYGGLGADKTTSMLMSATLSRVGSFSVSIGAHTGIGTLPIVYFGTKEQKEKYLPKLATGDMIAAYALTEPGAGSDALSARTRADLSEDGTHYVLNGTKQFITNAGFADLFTVFAQIDGDKFTAFLVERSSIGLSIGPEEHKLGIRGSSTCQVILTDCKVPVENVLGEIGRGHKIAFNILNVGRWKLGIGSIGGAREVLKLAAEYANQRKQFGKTIGEFGLIRKKLAEMATSIYVGESMAYRTAGLIDKRIASDPADGDDHTKHVVKAIEEYTIEASILKVYGSEVLDDVTDEALQIHGGYGYIEEYAIERFLRDARINRIFEGTNEINRLLITGTLLKRAMKGQLPLLQEVGKVAEALKSGTVDTTPPEGLLGVSRRNLEACKRAFLYSVSLAVQKVGTGIEEKQEVLGNLSDGVIDLFAMDSAIARTLQLAEAQGEDAAELALSMTRLFCKAAHERVFDGCREIVMWLTEGEEFGEEMETVSSEYKLTPLDALHLKDQIAGAVLAKGGYTLHS